MPTRAKSRSTLTLSMRERSKTWSRECPSAVRCSNRGLRKRCCLYKMSALKESALSWRGRPVRLKPLTRRVCASALLIWLCLGCLVMPIPNKDIPMPLLLVPDQEATGAMACTPRTPPSRHSSTRAAATTAAAAEEVNAGASRPLMPWPWLWAEREEKCIIHLALQPPLRHPPPRLPPIISATSCLSTTTIRARRSCTVSAREIVNVSVRRRGTGECTLTLYPSPTTCRRAPPHSL